ncbi:MAG: hypothetical protein IPJ03_14820 [Ignavibacteriales bacterium]|nr:hypothetical protein [Ignavibacteriales bacterium]
MKKVDYIPSTYDGQDTWAETFSTKLPSQSATLGVSPAQQTALLNAITEMRTAYAEQKVLETDYRSKVAEAETKRKAAISNPGGIRKIVALMKASSNYTTAIGEYLGIEASAPDPNPDDMQATIKVKLQPEGKVKVHCDMQGADAYNVYSKRADEVNFVFIGTSVTPWFVDDRPKLNGAPESRQYFNQLVIRNEEIGLPSPIMIVVVG